jgi:hypothetical protein
MMLMGSNTFEVLLVQVGKAEKILLMHETDLIKGTG